jgi:hypothetical protein
LNDCVIPDNGDPQLRGLSLSADSIDVHGGPQRVQLRVDAVDTGGPGPASGIERIVVNVAGPGSAVHTDLRPAADGSWEGSVTIHPGQAPGRYYVYEMEMYDRARSWKVYDREYLTRQGFDHEFHVVGPIAAGRPGLESVTLSRSAVDVRQGPRVVRVRVEGVNDRYVRRIQIRATPTHPQAASVRTQLRRTRQGAWAGRLAFEPGWNVNGKYLLQARVVDAEGFARSHHRGNRGAALPAPLTVTGGLEDPSPPEVISARFSPSTVDVRARDRSLTIRLQARDSGAGITRARASISSAHAYWESSTDLRRVAGTRWNGTWVGRLIVPRCLAATGNENLQIRVTDGGRRHDRVVLRPVPVLAEDHQPPVTGVTFKKRSPTGPLLFEWDEDVAGISTTSALLFEDYERSYVREPPPPVPGSWSCWTASGAPVDCVRGPVRLATFTPGQPLQTGTSYLMLFNPPGVLDVTDLAGNPVMSVFVDT